MAYGLTLTAASVQAGELRIGDSKNGEGRVIPLRDEHGHLNTAGQIIERRLAARVVREEDGTERVVPWLFHRKGRPVGEFRKAWTTACKAAGFVRPKLDKAGQPVFDKAGRPVVAAAVLFHDLRRSFAKDAVDSGNDPHVVCKVGGWKTMAVMNRYNIVDTARMAAALSRLEQARKAPTATAALDLNQRPLGYEGERDHHSRQRATNNAS